MKTRILFIMHMPPPVHGAAMVGQWIHDSKIINEEFDTYYINPSVSNNISEVGRVSIFKIWLFLKLLIRIIKAIIKFKPDLCYYTPTSDGWGIYRDAITIFLMRLCGKKIILHFHNKGVKEFSARKTANIAYKIIFRKVKVILIAEQLYDDICKYVNKKDVYFLPNGIPPTISNNEYEIIKCKREKRGEKVKLLFLSNLIKTKGIILLLEACRLLKDKGISFECHYVGNKGTYSIEQFKGLINKYNLQNYIFVHGPKYGIEKKEYFINSDIFIFPTYHETFGLVLLEAMEYGLPCISTFEGGIPSIIDNMKNGILVEQKNTQQLYDAICLLIDNKELRISMGEYGRNIFMNRFKLEKFECNFKNILTKSCH